MKTNILIATYISLCFCIVTNAKAQDCHHSLQGIVADAENKEAIAYAQVVIKELKKVVSTDEKGIFEFKNLCNGTYTIEVSHIECVHESRQIIIGEEGTKVEFWLHHQQALLKEISITATAIEAKKTQANATLNGAALDATRGESLGDALKNIAGVNSINTGATVSKPVIQGMHSNRVLIFNNGVRQEGQQWGLDHAPEIDPFTADKLTVIKGAGSVIYGADAIGGIVLVEPKTMRQIAGIDGTLNMAGFTNGQVGATAIMVEGAANKHNNGHKLLSWRLQASLKKGGNIHTPDYYLANTGLNEQNFSASVQRNGNKFRNYLYFSHFGSDVGIFKGAHIGNLEDLKTAFSSLKPLVSADFTYKINRPLQRISHELFKWKNTWKSSEKSQLVTQFSLQKNNRGEFDAHRLFGQLPNDLTTPNLSFTIYTGAINSTLEHELGIFSKKKDGAIHGKLGAEYTYQNNITEKGGLIPSYVSMNYAAFLTERWHPFNRKWELEGGIRYDYKWLNVRLRKVNAEEEGVLKSYNFQSTAGQFGGIYKANEHLNFSANMGTAWRAPTVNELFSLGVHHGTASFERGNPNLKTERAVNNTFSSIYNTEKLKLQVDLYGNFIKNFIYLKPDTATILTIRGAFPAFNYTQTNARLLGFDWNFDWNFYQNIYFENKGSILRAKNMETNEWLIMMPADRFQTGLKTRFLQNNKKWKDFFVGANMTNVLNQTRVPLNQDYVAAPKGYILFGAETGISVLLGKNPLQISFSVQNLSNVAYRDYLNRFRYFANDIGRNFQLRTKWSF